MQAQPFVVLALLSSSLACSHSTPPAEAARAAPATSVSSSSAPSASTGANTGGPEQAATEVPAHVRAAIAAADRSADDRALDEGRKPELMLTFFGIAPGMKVAEIGAGGGYTAELLARTVGPSGVVYGQNSPFILQRFANGPWSERLAKPAMRNVVRVDREFDDPLPPEAVNLDVVLDVLFYHDTVWLGVDRAKMNRAVFAALKPGGVYGIIDHSGLPGSGLTGVKTIHRIEEKILRSELESAGFQFASEAPFLRNPQDTRDWNDSPREAGSRRGTSDRFVLAFKKPSTHTP